MKTRSVFFTITIESILLTILIAMMLFLNSCSQGGNTARVTIHTGLSRQAALEQMRGDSLLERLLATLDFLATEAIAAPAPLNIVSMYLSIDGPDMSPMGTVIPLVSGSVTMEVPAGSNRTFTVVAMVDPADPGTVASYGGSALADLSPGEEKELSITMGVREAKIIIPDYLNGRLVQMDDMTGSGWTAANFSLANFSPWKVDMDFSGRVYIANKNFSLGRVIRVNSMSDGSPYLGFAAPSTIYGIESVTVDRARGLVFYLITNTLYTHEIRRADFNGGGDAALAYPVPNYIKDIAVDDGGMLYILYGSDSYTIVRVNPDTGAVTHLYDDNAQSTGYLFGATGLLVKQPYVYVANPQNSAVVQFTAGLQFVQQRGVIAPNPPVTQPLEFYGPYGFTAILNKRITIIDDGWFNFSTQDRLVAMDDINGGGWTPFGSWGSGVNQFRFYAGC